MVAKKLDGELVAAEIRRDLVGRIESLVAKGVRPGLGTVLVGDDGPSAKYVAMKHRDAEELGVASMHRHLSADVTQAAVAETVAALNADPNVDAFLLQYPFPAGLDYAEALSAVDPEKDVDGLHPVNLGRLVMDEPGPTPCTPAGIERLLAYYDIPVAGRHVVIVGRGLTIGRPLANLLSRKAPTANAAVTVVHTGVADIAAYTTQADILVAAAGTPGLISAEMVKPGVVVVAAGVSFVEGKLVSDVQPEVAEVAAWLSPRVGGVGPMTRAMLFANTVSAAERRAGLRT